MTLKNDQFKAFFRMFPQKLAILSKRGHFRAKSHIIKVVENAILNISDFITFFPGMNPKATNDS